MGRNHQEGKGFILKNHEVGPIFKSSYYTLIYHSSVDPFNRPIEYTATNKALIDRVVYAGKRLLSPHGQLLQMLLSRFQSVRYRRSGLILVIHRLFIRSTKAYESFR